MSCHGLALEQVHRLWRAPVTEAGISGQAVATGELVVVDRYADSGAAITELADHGIETAMAAPPSPTR